MTHNNIRIRKYGFFREACDNERVTEGIIRYLLEYFPNAARATAARGALHCACENKNVTKVIIEILIDAAPDSVRSVNFVGMTPLHCLCDNNRNVDEATAVQILNVFIEKCPEAVRHASTAGFLPIHTACRWRSPEFYRVLIEAYPGSERIADVTHNRLPLHHACLKGSLETVELFYRQYPEAINHAACGGRRLPIVDAIMGGRPRRENPATAAEIVRFLLECDPNQALIEIGGKSLLQHYCYMRYDDSSIEAGVQMIKALFDAHPEAIEGDRIASNIHHCHQQVQEFINNQLVYARQAKDLRLMTNPDENGQLPLHTALRNNVTLGSIKLLVKGNPDALQSADNNGALPLHVACEHSLGAIELLAKGNPSALQSADNSGRLPLHLACQHRDSSKVIDFLGGFDPSTLDAVDGEGNSALHLACRNAKYVTIRMLLENFDAVSVSKRNADGKLPIELLWESNVVEDRESIEYTESVFQLLKAFPETVMNCSENHEAKTDDSDSSSESNERKRKYSADD